MSYRKHEFRLNKGYIEVVSCRFWSFLAYITCAIAPGAPLTYFNDGGVRQRFIFYTQKNPNFRICLPKRIPTFLAYPWKHALF